MFPPRHATSRYLTAARRAHVVRLAAAGALVVVPTACGTSDAEVFSAASDAVPASTIPAPAGTAPATTVAAAPPATDAPAATSSPPTPPATPPTTTPVTGPALDTATFPAGAEMIVQFTYLPDTTFGRVLNPYIAVWIEDTDGSLIRTISVWFEQSQKGTRWLSDLRQWSSVAGDQIAVDVTGATRQPGSYSLVWDGTDDAGEPVAQGEYVLAVESAREHGPYHVTATTITVSDAGFEIELPDDGELVELTATMRV